MSQFNLLCIYDISLGLASAHFLHGTKNSPPTPARVRLPPTLTVLTYAQLFGRGIYRGCFDFQVLDRFWNHNMFNVTLPSLCALSISYHLECIGNRQNIMVGCNLRIAHVLITGLAFSSQLTCLCYYVYIVLHTLGSCLSLLSIDSLRELLRVCFAIHSCLIMCMF